MSLVRHARDVLDVQGFRPGERGRSVTAVFAGRPGTGKTTAAEAVGNALELDVFRVDLSQVVDKYVGETEKHLAELFDAAEGGGCVLLFDEADALFGRRGEVREARDRYANQGVSYLLQRLEAFTGIAVLTTNLEQDMDEAFVRRVRLIVRFEDPTPDERLEIWRRAIPVAARTEPLDLERLAALDLSGAGISNVALAGAFLAAADSVPLGTRHLLRAARTEYEKLGRLWPPGFDDAGGAA